MRRPRNCRVESNEPESENNDTAGYLLRSEVDSFSAPGINGYFGVLPSHAPMVSAIGKVYLKSIQEETASIRHQWGIAEITARKLQSLPIS